MKSLRVFPVGIAWAAVLIALVANVAAQQPLKAGYFTGAHNPNLPDGRVTITSPGFFTGSNGELCAMIYVFYPDQQMTECCGCMTTPDGERELSINTDLTSNPLISIVPQRGAIRVVSAPPNSSGVCDPSNLTNPQRELLVWGTHPVDSSGTSSTQMTETEYPDAPLSAHEASDLGTFCHDVTLLGSGRGRCTCGTGD